MAQGQALSLWVFLLGAAVVACNLVHELGAHEQQALSLDPAPMVGEANGVHKSAAEVAEDEIAALAGDVRKKLPVVTIVQTKSASSGNRNWSKQAEVLVAALENLHVKLTQRNLELLTKLYEPPSEGLHHSDLSCGCY